MPELHWQMKRLQVLRDKCGGNPNKPSEPTVDLSKMSEYERQQYKIAESMKRIRENIMELDNLPEGASTTKRVDLRQQVRKDVMALDKAALEARRWAKEENRKEDYEKLVGHVKKTQNLWNQRFQEGGAANAGLAELMSPKGSGAQKLDEEMGQLSQPMVNLHEDQEFQMFFEQCSKKDQEIDAALDMVAAGVTVLAQQAKTINTELKVQKALLEETEEKMEKNITALMALNKKLKHTIKEVNKDKLCLYVICCALLVALAGTAYFVLKDNSRGDPPAPAPAPAPAPK